MKRFLSWLESKPVHQVEQEITAAGDVVSDLDVPSKADVAGWKEDHEPPVEDHTVTVPILRIPELNAPHEQNGSDTCDATVSPE